MPAVEQVSIVASQAVLSVSVSGLEEMLPGSICCGSEVRKAAMQIDQQYHRVKVDGEIQSSLNLPGFLLGRLHKEVAKQDYLLAAYLAKHV